MARFLEKKRFFKSYLDDKSTFFDPKNNMQKKPSRVVIKFED